MSFFLYDNFDKYDDWDAKLVDTCQKFYDKFERYPNYVRMNEKTFSDGTIVRFVNGYIDGNIYDHFGNVIYTHPAIEYPGGQEYWTKGYPHGLPAIQFFDVIDGAYYEEYWIVPCSAFISLQVQKILK